MNYYYLVASLPSIALGTAPALGAAHFEALCREQLGARDMDGLRELQAGHDGEPRHRFARDWRAAETRLRNAVARGRASRLKRDPAPYLRPQAAADVSLEHGVHEAFTRPDPLERELALDRLRWRQAEELAGLDPFTGRAVLAYRVKLGLAERWAAMSEEQGAGRKEAVVSGAAPEQAADVAAEAP